MESIKNHLQKVQVQNNSLAPLNLTSELTIEDKKVLDLKYSAKQFGKMEPAEVLANGKALLLKIHIITGWTIPEKELMTILVDQFTKTLTEKYDQLNANEIEFAFRSKGTVVEDWGKSMNLNLLDKILIPYLNDRYKISEIERQISYKKTMPPFSLEDLNYRQMIEEDYQFFLGGKNLVMFPVHYYKTLVEDGFINVDSFKDFEGTDDDTKKDKCISALFHEARDKGYKNLYERS